jgi:hypothetical protein
MTEIQNPKQRRCVGGYSRFGHADFEFRYRFRREASCGDFAFSTPMKSQYQIAL